MNRALLYLEWRSLAGGMRIALARMKRPRYLITTVVGLAYFAFFMWQPVRAARGELAAFDGSMRLVATLLVTGSFCLAWMLGRGGSLHFDPAEIDFLFPAPLRRKELIRYRLLHFQKAFLAFSVLPTLMAAANGAGGRSLAILSGVALTLNVLLLHGIVVAYLLKRVGGALGVLFRVAPATVVAGSLAATSVRLSSRRGSDWSSWMEDLVSTHPAGIVLAPARALADLTLARDPASFALHLAPVLLMLVLLYLVVERVDFPFEEVEIEGARRRAARIEALRRGRFRAIDRKAKPTRWPLAAEGPAWRAIAWKNLVAASRNPPIGIAASFLSLPVVGLLIFGPAAAREIACFFFPALAVLLSGIAPLLTRDDLRNDLELLDVLKSYPVPGRELLRGEVLGVALAVGIVQGIVLTAAFLLCPEESRLGGFSASLWAAGLAVLPALTITSFLIANGLALLFPAWSRIERLTTGGAAAGAEGIGYTLVLGFAQAVGLGALLVGPALVAGAIALLGHLAMGSAAIAVGAAFGAAGLLAEDELLLRWLGRRLERLDPSEEASG